MMSHLIPGLRRTIALVAASATVAVAALVATSTASAYTVSNTLRPGTVITYKTTGSFNMGYGSISSGPITAYRSPAPGGSGTQKVTIRMQLWDRYPGTWRVVYDRTDTFYVYSNQSGAYDPGFTYETPLLSHFATVLTITWRSSTGTLLGQTVRDYVHSGDYQCLVSNGCGVVWAGGQYTLKLW